MSKITRLYLMALTAILSFTITSVAAQETPAEPEPEPESGLNVSGFVDAYYQHSFTNTVFPTSFTPNNNSFSLGMANLVLSREGKVGFVADIAVGPRAEAANGYAGSALSFIKQLYVSYAASDALTFTLGNFSTHVGYEVIDSKTNINYSTSYMFSYGPFFHTGIKANLALSDKFGAMVGVFNDTDTKIDVVSGKHLGAQLSYSGDKLSAYLNYLGGRVADLSDVSPETMAHQVDLTASYQATDAFALGLNATTKRVLAEGDDAASWSGLALYAKYDFSDVFTLGLRGEHINDPSGLILAVADEKINSFTVSGNIHLGSLTVIPEFRVDTGVENSFSSLSGDGLKQASGMLLAVVYSF